VIASRDLPGGETVSTRSASEAKGVHTGTSVVPGMGRDSGFFAFDPRAFSATRAASIDAYPSAWNWIEFTARLLLFGRAAARAGRQS
jgi:hypothetical protein